MRLWNRHRLALLAASALALAACGPKPADQAASSTAPPASLADAGANAVAPPDVVADAAVAAKMPKDQPNFRVCASNALDAGDFAPLEAPAGVVFISWGKKAGDERNPKLDSNMLAPGAVRYVVVLAKPVTLTKAAPCAETIARAATSVDFDWRLPLVRQSQDLQFQVTGVEDHMAFPLTNRLGELVKKGLIFGYPTADIGAARALHQES